MSIFAKFMENDADHNVGRMKLDHAPTQVASPRFLVTRAAVLRHDTADASISDLWPLSLPRSELDLIIA